MKFGYKYPQQKFPYEEVIKENGRRTRQDPEYNLVDTGVFEDNAYWDIIIEMGKEANDPEELLFRVIAYNRGDKPAPLHIIPTVWFKNTWAWGREKPEDKPWIRRVDANLAQTNHPQLGKHFVELSPSPGTGPSAEDVLPKMLFTDNDTNYAALGWGKNKTKYVKDAFHQHICNGDRDAVNSKQSGTKMGAWYAFDDGEGVPPGECAVVRFRFTKRNEGYLDEELFDDTIEARRMEADEFYNRISPMPMADDLRNIQRQAFAGMLWCKQHYYFVWDQWANGDPSMPPPPPERKKIRNEQWKHLHMDDIISMPDSWEYPFFAAWDSAFHCIPLAMIDPEFAKKQLDLFTREWYMHPNGQLPAYEWNFGDVNPPVHAWSTFRTFKIERKMYGREDLDFLERVFQKLLLNFTWWVNRKDSDGKNVFEGGFLGLDNIGLFNRSEDLPTGGKLEQADSTGWMAFYCSCMMNMALELAKHRRIYEDMANKFFEHFILISDAMQWGQGGESKPLWNDEDGFYYDAISWGGPWSQQMPVRSLVGLIPLYATCTLEPDVINRFPQFKKRLEWFMENRKDVAGRNLASLNRRGKGDRLLLSLVNEDRLRKILTRMLDEKEFLSDYGIRSLSRYHKDHPYSMDVNGQRFEVSYLPGDSNSGLFGGNSNWRGPIWCAVNFLLIEAILRFYMFYGDTFKIECPTGSGDMMHLGHVAEELQHRLQHLFVQGDDGRRAINAGNDMLDFDPHWKDNIWFFEFFDGDSGQGLGASHQTGWTGLIAKMIHDTGYVSYQLRMLLVLTARSVNCRLPQTPRTPSAAAAHYFDDMFSKPGKRGGPRLLRRSSTTRNIGNGQLTDNDDDEEEDLRDVRRQDSVGVLDDEALARKKEFDDRVADYVANQLRRIQTNDSVVTDEMEAELEAT